MLFKSGQNIESEAIHFIQKNDVITLFSAYIRTEQLKRINDSKHIKAIVVRWEIQDLFVGASDRELYAYCKENGIVLYRNTRIHLKAIWNNNDKIVLGSANVTGRGLGELGNFNYELNGEFRTNSFSDVLYLNKIISSSQLVDEQLYNEIISEVDKIEFEKQIFPTLNTRKSKADHFLLSDLPMTASIEGLYHGYEDYENLNQEEMSYIVHDVALYDIKEDLNREEFVRNLKEKFNSHPFILALKGHIQDSPRKSLSYGSVVRWIQDNTTTVPTPRSWEMKRKMIVNILYDWICYFDNQFYWDRPNHSQIIYFRIK